VTVRAEATFSSFNHSSSNNDERGEQVRFIDENATQEERTWATFMHLAGFSSVVLGLGPLAIIAPLVLWLMKRNESPFIDDHGKEAVNFQISLWLWIFVSGILIFCGIGILLIFALPIFSFVMMIIMAIRANNGEYVRYPITIRFIS